MDAYSRGYADFTKGKSAEENPYTDPLDHNHTAWLSGWDYGMLLLQITPPYNSIPI